MIVLQSTFDKVRQQRDHEKSVAIHWQIKHSELQSRWNKVVEQINAKGGEDFLKFGTLNNDAPKTVHQFTDDELRSLIQLVHPDKHDGKESAVRLTQKINDLRAK